MRRTLFKQFPPPTAAARTLQGLGANGTAPIDNSVSAQTRAARGLLSSDGVSITGAYVDYFRQNTPGVIQPIQIPRIGSGLNRRVFPSSKQYIGATLAAAPGRQQANYTTASVSPSVARERLLRSFNPQLSGLGAGGYGPVSAERGDNNDWSGLFLGAYEDRLGNGDLYDDKGYPENCHVGGLGCLGYRLLAVRKALDQAGHDPHDNDAVKYFGATKWWTVGTLANVISQNWDHYINNVKLPDDNYPSGITSAVDKYISDKGGSVAADAQKAAAAATQKAADDAIRAKANAAQYALDHNGQSPPAVGADGKPVVAAKAPKAGLTKTQIGVSIRNTAASGGVVGSNTVALNTLTAAGRAALAQRKAAQDKIYAAGLAADAAAAALSAKSVADQAAAQAKLVEAQAAANAAATSQRAATVAAAAAKSGAYVDPNAPKSKTPYIIAAVVAVAAAILANR